MIRALVFDFDGLIFDTETALIDAFEIIHRREGKAFSRELALAAVGLADIPFDPWTAFGPTADRPALESQLAKTKKELLAKQSVMPGVTAYLQEARARGLKIGLASNSGHFHVESHLAHLALMEYFDCLRCIEDVAAGKPAPDLYRAVLENFGVAGTEAIAFEDSEHGATAAKRAGLWCVAVPGPATANHPLDHADLILSSLADQPLAALLDKFGR